MSKLHNGYYKFQIKNINIIDEIKKEYDKKDEGNFIENVKYQIYRNKKYKDRFDSQNNTFVIYVEAEKISDEELELLLDYYMPRKFSTSRLTYNLVRTIYLIINTTRLSDNFIDIINQSIELPLVHGRKVMGNVIIPAIYCKEKQELCVGYVDPDGFINIVAENYYNFMCTWLYTIFNIVDKKKCKKYLITSEKRKKRIYHSYSMKIESKFQEIFIECVIYPFIISYVFFNNYILLSFLILLLVFAVINVFKIKKYLDMYKYLDKILIETTDETQFIDKIVSIFIPQSKNSYILGKSSVYILNQKYSENLLYTKFNYIICRNYDTLKTFLEEKKLDNNTLIMYFNNDNYLHIYNDNLKLKHKFFKIVAKQLYNAQERTKNR